MMQAIEMIRHANPFGGPASLANLETLQWLGGRCGGIARVDSKIDFRSLPALSKECAEAFALIYFVIGALMSAVMTRKYGLPYKTKAHLVWLVLLWPLALTHEFWRD